MNTQHDVDHCHRNLIIARDALYRHVDMLVALSANPVRLEDIVDIGPKYSALSRAFRAKSDAVLKHRAAEPMAPTS